ncbi:MAG: hypothetical protein AB8E82_16950 [Aureispira sp.]
MSTDYILDEIQPTTGGKVYNDKMLFFAAFFSGPLAAGYLMIGNYKTLGQQEKVSFAWLATIVSTFLYMIAIIVFDSYVIELPSLLYSLLCVFASKAVFRNTQEAEVEAYIKQGGNLHSNWQVTGIIAGAFMIILMMTMAILFLFSDIVETDIEIDETVQIEAPIDAEDNNTEDVVRSIYGDLEHAIIYDRAQINDEMVDELANKLIDIDFFDQSTQRQIYLDVEVDRYVFLMVETEDRATNSSVQEQYRALKQELDTWLNASSIDIVLVDETWEQEFVSL